MTAEKDILKDMLVDESETIQNLAKIVQKAKCLCDDFLSKWSSLVNFFRIFV